MSEVIFKLLPSKVTVAPLMSGDSAAAQFTKVSQFATTAIVCGVPPSTTTIKFWLSPVKSCAVKEVPFKVPDVGLPFSIESARPSLSESVSSLSGAPSPSERQ